MTAVINATHSDPEATALAACYRLLLQKARERRERLAKTAVAEIVNEAAVSSTEQPDSIKNQL